MEIENRIQRLLYPVYKKICYHGDDIKSMLRLISLLCRAQES